MEPHVICARRLQQPHCAFHVGGDEWFRIGDGIIVVRFRGEVHNGVAFRHQTVEQRGVADIPHHQFDLRLRQSRDVLRIARIRQLVQYGDVHVRMIARHVPHEIGADEPTSAGHQNMLRPETIILSHAAHRSSIPSTTTQSRISGSTPHSDTDFIMFTLQTFSRYRQDTYSSRHTG